MKSESQKGFVTFNLHYKCNYGDSVYVVLCNGEDERMRLESAIRLDCYHGDYWSKTVTIEFEGAALRFNYKYIVAPTELKSQGFIRWEQGLRRCFRAENAANRRFRVEDRWQHQKIKVMLKDMFGPETRGRRSIGIVSRCLGLHENCTELRIESCREHPIGDYWVSDVYWIPLTEERIDIYAYFLKTARKSVVKNRRFDLKYLLNPEKMIEGRQKGVLINENSILFVEEPRYEQFIFSEINSRLVLGSCINDSKEEDLLLGENCGAIFCLETPKDRSRCKRARKSAVQEGSIPTYNYPIEDCPESLIHRAVKGAQYLNLLVETHRRVYVHCTYGAFRSVHVVIAYLHLYEGLELLQAIELVQKARSQANIREDVCTKMLQYFEKTLPQTKKTETMNFQSFFWKKNSDLCYQVI